MVDDHFEGPACGGGPFRSIGPQLAGQRNDEPRTTASGQYSRAGQCRQS